jgi:hypothetical protein
MRCGLLAHDLGALAVLGGLLDQGSLQFRKVMLAEQLQARCDLCDELLHDLFGSIPLRLLNDSIAIFLIVLYLCFLYNDP